MLAFSNRWAVASRWCAMTEQKADGSMVVQQPIFNGNTYKVFSLVILAIAVVALTTIALVILFSPTLDKTWMGVIVGFAGSVCVFLGSIAISFMTKKNKLVLPFGGDKS